MSIWFKHVGCSTLEMVMFAEPEFAEYYRRVVTGADSVFEFRWKKWDDWPNPLAAVPDHRRPRPVRLHILHLFFSVSTEAFGLAVRDNDRNQFQWPCSVAPPPLWGLDLSELASAVR